MGNTHTHTQSHIHTIPVLQINLDLDICLFLQYPSQIIHSSNTYINMNSRHYTNVGNVLLTILIQNITNNL